MQRTTATNLRKSPKQERSRGLVDAVLEGAARILRMSPDGRVAADDRAPDPTTNRIAEVAGVSIGSLYQYFPGKKSILAALAQKRIRTTYDALLAEIESARGLPLEAAVARVVDAFVDMKLAHGELDAGVVKLVVRHGLLDDAAFALDEEYVDRFATALEAWKPAVRADLPGDVAAYVIFQSVRSVMILGSLQRPELTSDPRLRSELKTMLFGYLTPR